MAKRTYVPSLMFVALRMCTLVARGTPIITRLYPENVALLTALSAANTACGILAEELAKVRNYGI